MTDGTTDAQNELLQAPIGRPSLFSEQVTTEICAKLAEGWSLGEICKAAHLPSRSCVHAWLMEAEKQRNDGQENKLTEFSVSVHKEVE